MEDVLQVYQLPYDRRYPVVCMDEASKQLTIFRVFGDAFFMRYGGKVLR